MAQQRVHDTMLNRVYVYDDATDRWRIEDPVTKNLGVMVSKATVQAAAATAAARAAATPAPAAASPPPRPTVVPQPAAAPAPAAAAPPPPPPPPVRPVAAAATPPAPPTPPPGVVQAPKETGMRLKNIAVAAAVVAILIVGAFFFGRAGDTTTLSERRVADIAAATVDLRIKPLTGDIEALGRDTKALKEGFVKYNEAIDNKFKQQGDVLANIKQLLESKGPTSPPAAATPSTPAMSALEQQRRTQVQAECLPEDQRVDVKDDLGDEAFNALIAHCKANKMAKQRMVSPPPAAGHPQVAQGDPQAEPEAGLVDEESDAQAPGQPRPQQVGYGYGPQPYGAPRHGMGPGYGAPHPGMHRGHPRCPPGSNFNPQFGKCIGTRLHHIPLHPEAQAAFPTCRTIETRLVWKGGRLVEQQRGIACRRPAGVYQ